MSVDIRSRWISDDAGVALDTHERAIWLHIDVGGRPQFLYQLADSKSAATTGKYYDYVPECIHRAMYGSLSEALGGIESMQRSDIVRYCELVVPSMRKVQCSRHAIDDTEALVSPLTTC